ncbi:MAG TPA: lysophospholipid acyltransferase family protein [Saprospiraceae bacterium]|nr:lysophospholipid acyltransferase family protein [Saprospiraceae bacterium]
MSETSNEHTSQKAYEGRRFTYSSENDSWLKRQVILTIEWLTGRNQLQKIYDEIHEENPTPFNVWGNGLRKLNIKMDFDEAQLEKIPKEGPLIFVANHPFGVVDGAILLHIATRVRKDYFVLVNEVVSHEPVLEGHFLPVDFRQNEAALQTNLRTKEQTTERLNKGQALVIFPSGAVSTARRFFGPVEEFPWRRFICTRIHETKCSVVPIYFHGRNSRLFQFVSKFSMNLRLGLLLYEVMNKRGKTLKIEIGEPIHYPEMEEYEDRQMLIDFLKDRTMSLSEK